MAINCTFLSGESGSKSALPKVQFSHGEIDLVRRIQGDVTALPAYSDTSYTMSFSQAPVFSQGFLPTYSIRTNPHLVIAGTTKRPIQ